MSLNDLLPLLFVAFLVVNAILRGRRAQRSGKPDQRPRTSRPEGTDGRSVADSAPAREEAQAPPGDAADDELTRRIEEARRRVREAMGEPVAEERPRAPGPRETAATRRAEGPAQRGGPVPPARPPAQPGTLLGPMGAPVPSAPPQVGFLGREGTPPGPARAPEPRSKRPTVTRRASDSRSATLRAAKGLGASRDDIVRGFVWSVVFEEPVAHRMRRRRTVSQRR